MTTNTLIYFVIWPIAFILLVLSLYLLYKYPSKNNSLEYWSKVLYWLGLLVLIVWPFIYLFFGNWGVAFGFVIMLATLSCSLLIMLCFTKRKYKSLLLTSYGVYTTWIIVCSILSATDFQLY